MKKITGIILFFFSTTFVYGSKKIELTITTTIMIAEENIQDLITLIHDDSKALSKKYLQEDGVISIETEVENQTLMRKFRQ